MKKHLEERNEKIKAAFATMRESGVSAWDCYDKLARAFKLSAVYIRDIVYQAAESQPAIEK